MAEIKNTDGLELFNYRGEAPDIKLVNLKVKHQSKKFIEVPEGVSVIWRDCFHYSRARVVILPDGLTEICKQAFDGKSSLRAVYIPASVQKIGDGAFAGCKKLEIYCGGEPQPEWLDGEPITREYEVDMTDAFNFHRSGGSFDDRYTEHRVEVITNNYNPLKRPVHTFVTREEFKNIVKNIAEQ